MKVAVTGGAGFIGSHLADAIISSGHEVLIIDDLSTGEMANVNAAARFMKRDIRSDLAKDLEGVDAVFHLAAASDVRSSALSPERSFESNVRGTFSLLESCRKAGVERFLLASSSTVYGIPSSIPTPETHPCAPISNYGASKLCCEAYLSSYSASYGIRGTALRLANIFGPRSRHGVIHDFFAKLRKDPGTLEIMGDGKQDKSYLYVSDCVSALITAWKAQKPAFEAYNVGSGEKVTVDGLAALVGRAMGLEPKVAHISPGGHRGAGWPGDVRVMLLDSSKLRAAGWKPEVPLEEGTARYMRWLSEAGASRSP